MWNINIYSFILLFNSLLTIVLGINIVLKKKVKGKVFFSLLMVSIFIWSLTDSLGLATNNLANKILFAKIAYFGVASTAPLFFLFFYNFLQGDKKLNTRKTIAIWIIPLAILILAFTNEYHLLIWSTVTPLPGTNGELAVFEHGIGVYVNMLYSYSLILYVVYLLFKIAYLYRQVYRKQAIIMIIATLVPLCGNFLYVFKLNPFPSVDLTSILFTVSAFMITWGLTSYRFLDTKPIAHGKLFLNMSDSVLVLDGYLNVADVNPSLEKLFGLQGLIGKNVTEVFQSYQGLSKILSSKEESINEIPININGKNLWLDVRTNTLLDLYKDIIGMLIVIRDITENKNAENIIKESEKNLKDMVATKDKFFSIIAHDLRSPFSALLGLSEVFKDDIETLTDYQKKDFADLIYRSAKSTYKLIENLLEWTRLQTGKFELINENLDLWQISSEICNALIVNAQKKNIVINNKIPKGTIILSDKNMLKLLFNNLITNAIKFSYKGGEIYLKSEKRDDGIEISVSDSGTGIKKEYMGKIFRTDISFSMKGTEKEEGTGLGLILCKEIIEKTGGKIWVESEEGKGSIFRILIPQTTSNHE
ncbi:MAG: histidine kinase N-terminal 7TM domain-containing protein [Ignavibacteria bacterium]|jgi:PAS domain S-box-containing protein